jgi:hypothetical protein
MPIQESEKYATSITSGDNVKFEETVISDYVEEDGLSETNEFGHGTGSFLTAYFNVTVGHLMNKSISFATLIHHQFYLYSAVCCCRHRHSGSPSSICDRWLAGYPYYDLVVCYGSL